MSHDIATADRDQLWLAGRLVRVPNFSVLDSGDTPAADLPGKAGSRVVCVANLRPAKDQVTVVRAMAAVARTHPQAHLLLVGSDLGAYADLVRSEIARLDVGASVTLLGVRTDVAAVLAGSDIGVLGSVEEGTPLAVLEYGLSELAVVATAVGEVAEVLGGSGARPGARRWPASSSSLAIRMASPVHWSGCWTTRASGGAWARSCGGASTPSTRRRRCWAAGSRSTGRRWPGGPPPTPGSSPVSDHPVACAGVTVGRSSSASARSDGQTEHHGHDRDARRAVGHREQGIGARTDREEPVPGGDGRPDGLHEHHDQGRQRNHPEHAVLGQQAAVLRVGAPVRLEHTGAHVLRDAGAHPEQRVLEEQHEVAAGDVTSVRGGSDRRSGWRASRP